MDERTYDRLSRDELSRIEEQLDEVDPDDVDVTSSDGVLKLQLRDGVKVVINTQRPARQIWMAAVANAWHFSRDESDGLWRTSDGQELRQTLASVIRERIGVAVSL